MTIPVLSAAKRLGESSGWSLSNLELQKLIYIAHMFYLGRHQEPLVSGHFEAWAYGPVHPTLYHKAKVFGSSAVQNIFHSAPDLGDCPEGQILDDAVDQLSHAAPGRLVAITHWEKGAWAKHYRPGARGIVIPNDDILEEFRDRANAIRVKRAERH